MIKKTNLKISKQGLKKLIVLECSRRCSSGLITESELNKMIHGVVYCSKKQLLQLCEGLLSATH